MQHGAVLRGVEVVPAEHAVDFVRQLRRLTQRQQQLLGVHAHALVAVVQHQPRAASLALRVPAAPTTPRAVISVCFLFVGWCLRFHQ